MQFEGHRPGQIRLAEAYLRHRLIYSIFGLVCGLFFSVIGWGLLLNGIAGTTTLVVRITGLQVHVNDAAPGVVSILVGAFLIYVTRYKVDVKLGP